MNANKEVKKKVGRIIRRQNETLYSRVSVSDLLWGYENKNLKVIVDFLDAYFEFHPLNDTKYGLMYQVRNIGAVEYWITHRGVQ